MGLHITTKDLKEFHIKKKPEKKKNPKVVQTRSLSNSDIEKAGKNGPDETETE